MSQIKTAVSIDEGLFKEADRVAQKTHVSRSRLFEKALKELLRKERQNLMVDEINSAISEDREDKEDGQVKVFMQRQQIEYSKSEW